MHPSLNGQRRFALVRYSDAPSTDRPWFSCWLHCCNGPGNATAITTEYYFRPEMIFRILKKAMFDGYERKRLCKHANKSFLKPLPEMGRG